MQLTTAINTHTSPGTLPPFSSLALYALHLTERPFPKNKSKHKSKAKCSNITKIQNFPTICSFERRENAIFLSTTMCLLQHGEKQSLCSVIFNSPSYHFCITQKGVTLCRPDDVRHNRNFIKGVCVVWGYLRLKDCRLSWRVSFRKECRVLDNTLIVSW